jgi:ribokinase
MTKILACGFVNLDMIAAGLPRLPGPGEVVYAPNGVKFWIGGHTANVSVDLLQLGARRGDVAIAAAVGDDVAGDFIEDFLLTKGVECHLQKVPGVDTGKSVVLVRAGQDRSFVMNGGANSRLDSDHVMRTLDGFSPQILYLACGVLGDFDLHIADLFRVCRARGITTILDMVEPDGKAWDFGHPALPFVDVMHSNRLELAGITGTSDAEEGLSFLAAKGVRLAILSDGGAGLVALNQGHFIRQDAFRVAAVDPTGAGDAFCAGLAHRLSGLLGRGMDPLGMPPSEVSEMLLYGQAAGASCVGEIGTTPGVTSGRVAELVEMQGTAIREGTRTDANQRKKSTG